MASGEYISSGGHEAYDARADEYSFKYILEEETDRLEATGMTGVSLENQAMENSLRVYETRHVINVSYWQDEVERKVHNTAVYEIHIDERDGKKKLQNSESGDFLDDMLSNAERYYKETNQEHKINQRETEAILRAEETLVSGEATSVLYPVWHESGNVRYVTEMTIEDGVVKNHYIDVGKIAKRDLTFEEAKKMFHTIEENGTDRNIDEHNGYPLLLGKHHTVGFREVAITTYDAFRKHVPPTQERKNSRSQETMYPYGFTNDIKDFDRPSFFQQKEAIGFFMMAEMLLEKKYKKDDDREETYRENIDVNGRIFQTASDAYTPFTKEQVSTMLPPVKEDAFLSIENVHSAPRKYEKSAMGIVDAPSVSFLLQKQIQQHFNSMIKQEIFHPKDEIKVNQTDSHYRNFIYVPKEFDTKKRKQEGQKDSVHVQLFERIFHGIQGKSKIERGKMPSFIAVSSLKEKINVKKIVEKADTNHRVHAHLMRYETVKKKEHGAQEKKQQKKEKIHRIKGIIDVEQKKVESVKVSIQTAIATRVGIGGALVLLESFRKDAMKIKKKEKKLFRHFMKKVFRNNETTMHHGKKKKLERVYDVKNGQAVKREKIQKLVHKKVFDVANIFPKKIKKEYAHTREKKIIMKEKKQQEGEEKNIFVFQALQFLDKIHRVLKLRESKDHRFAQKQMKEKKYRGREKHIAFKTKEQDKKEHKRVRRNDIPHKAILLFIESIVLLKIFSVFQKEIQHVSHDVHTLLENGNTEQKNHQKDMETPWVLFSIIWYMSMIREQGMVSYVPKKKKKKKINLMKRSGIVFAMDTYRYGLRLGSSVL